ncbi:uncharacterized protein K460DRAFT_112883 [Cucurbitaria berberidis CBS 394.84]|uniref:Uncharacterized protein n=1 Tax=Cucurbitaria berberidis CBS 394.84 TaxID=1168544 RepID=A0A9P4GHP9_9PLEO|nr:uncharacterized protein K460DRAFT_112883 [Cucurbitaria berberidis CBS 394.84]KAF1845669.1 hypothetical protein K460DRAFT_112883 [Cucurbitaria berberidis CBS 394.84]
MTARRRHKNFAALGTSSVLCAAKVDSPFPRLLRNLYTVVSIVSLTSQREHYCSRSYTLCGSVFYSGALAGKGSNILFS